MKETCLNKLLFGLNVVTKFLDFSSSFILFRLDATKLLPKSVSHAPPLPINNVRIQLDCYGELLEKSSKRIQPFYMGANCKTERVGVEKNIWTDPNADFLPVFSDTHYLIIKTFEHAAIQVPLHPPSLGVQPIRQFGIITENYSSFKIFLTELEGQELTDHETIIDHTFKGNKINGLTIMETEKYVFTVQYPIKTLNVNEIEQMIQPDTGPVLFPDLTKNYDQILENIELAFIAWNKNDYAEFVLRKEKNISQDYSVFHYYEKQKLTVQNSMIISV